jgi:hypothetical protein
MTARALVLGLVVAVAGCTTAPTSVRVRLSAPATMVADSITLSVYDRAGRVLSNSPLGTTSKLPGDVLVLISPGAGEARALAVAWAGGALVGEAAGRVPVLPGKESTLGLQLVSGALLDGDKDGVPDAIDNCPGVPNSDQASSDGGSQGDACRPAGSGDGGASDGGVPITPPDLAGLDFALPPPPPGCGNGTLDSGEQCDSGSGNSDDPNVNATCTTLCRTRATCGSVAGSIAARVDAASGHCYVLWPGLSNFSVAQRDCQSRGGQLVSITSAAENELVRTLTTGVSAFIGLEVIIANPDTFVWVDGEAATFLDFAAGKPDNGGAPENCTMFSAGSGAWDDIGCGFAATGSLPTSRSVSRAYVCESGCGNGIVEPGEECDPPGSSCTQSCKRVRSCTESGGRVSPVNGHCYFEIKNNVDYPTALNACPSGTHLATLSDQAENEAAITAIGSTGPDAWIALRASKDVINFSWEAPTAELFTPSRFHGFTLTEEPNETKAPSCVRTSFAQGWRDKGCDSLFATLCERD